MTTNTETKETLAKAYAIGTYTATHDTAEDYDKFVSLEEMTYDEDGDQIFEIWEPFETYSLKDIQELVEQEYQNALTLLNKMGQLSKEVEVINLDGTVEKLVALEASFDNCPNCDSDNIDWGLPDGEAAMMWKTHKCEDCGCLWEETYELTKVAISMEAVR